MPVIGKQVMSRFFKTRCEKLAKLDLYPTKSCQRERVALKMPDPDRERPAAQAAKRIGDEWEAQKLAEILKVMGEERLLCARDGDGDVVSSYLTEPNMLPAAKAWDIIAQGQFDVGGATFAAEHGLTALAEKHGLDCQAAVPDLLFVLPPGTYTHKALPSGRTETLPEGDGRLQLRVVDIKVTEEPGANYFAEIAYYTMALAGWLLDRGLDDRFVVVPHGAVWPGSHAKSALIQVHEEGERDQAKLVQAIETELKEAPFSIFAPRIREFLRRDLPRLLDADWRTLPWHVDNHCQGCEYLGHNWYPNKQRSKTELAARANYCMPLAKANGHLSQIPFLPRGARRALEDRGVDSLGNVALAAEWAGRDAAGLNAQEKEAVESAVRIFAEHRALKTSRTIIGERAIALTTPGYRARIAPNTRTSASMPRWSALKIYVTATFDVSTAITLSFGVSAFWSRDRRFAEPAPRGGEPGPAADLPLMAGADAGAGSSPQAMGAPLDPQPVEVPPSDLAADMREEPPFPHEDALPPDSPWGESIGMDDLPGIDALAAAEPPDGQGCEDGAWEGSGHDGMAATPGVDAAADAAHGGAPVWDGNPGWEETPAWDEIPVLEAMAAEHDAVDNPAELDREFAEARRATHPGRETRDWHHWQAATFVVRRDDLDTEFEAFHAFLKHIDAIIRDARVQGTDIDGAEPASYQIYIWDVPTYEHIRRVVGRHLARLLETEGLEHLYNIFPADQQMRGAKLASKQSPYTVVKRVVETSLAAPIPHYYSLLNVARVYNMFRDARAAERMLQVSPLFDDPLSDHVPSERAHEIWKQSRDFERRLEQLEATVRKHLIALSTVTERLERDLRPLLAGAAPTVPDLAGRGGQAALPLPEPEVEAEEEGLLDDEDQGAGEVSEDGKLWLNYASLNTSMSAFEVDNIRAMPVFEREARGKSARLERRLFGDEEAEALRSLGLGYETGRRVYLMAPSSREVSARRAEIDWALAPEAEPGFLDRGVTQWFRSRNLEIPDAIASMRRGGAWRMESLTNVSIAALDRTRGLIVLDSSAIARGESALDMLEETGALDLSAGVVLDPIHVDMFITKLQRALAKIGNPPIAQAAPLSHRLTGRSEILPGMAVSANGGRVPTGHLPVADVLWNAKTMERAGSTDAEKLLRTLADHGITMNVSQREAFKKSLERCIHLIWGPPGTGKSHTIGAIIVAALLESVRRGARLRILVTAATWTAIDNILKELPRKFDAVIDGPTVQVARVRSATSRPPPDDCADFDLPLTRSQPSQAAFDLRNRLVQWNPTSADLSKLELTVVGATAHQVSNLVDFCGRRGEQGIFDLVIVDEGSQMDVATAAVSLLGLASGGRVICAGDWLQLAPIQQARPPEGLEPMLGSIYEFLLRVHGIEQTPLAVNHRSSAEIVGFFRQAGYETLTAHSPRMRIRMDGPLPDRKPDWWPTDEAPLPWSSHWRDVINPDRPLTCIVHADGKSNQASVFEAQTVAAIVTLLARHMLVGLSGRIGHDGTHIKVTDKAYRDDLGRFWREAIGIVTPHRAQQGLVIAELQKRFDRCWHDHIREAVDTVERFQGQERDVIIASFAMGDPDAIGGEAEFLYSLNRFNVMASRPRAKLIGIFSQELVDHLAGDVGVMEQSRLLKLFAETPEANRIPLALPWYDAGEERIAQASLRWHDANVEDKSQPKRRAPVAPKSPCAARAAAGAASGSAGGKAGGKAAAAPKPAKPRGGLDSLGDDIWATFK